MSHKLFARQLWQPFLLFIVCHPRITHSAGEEISCGNTFNQVDWVAEQRKDQVISRVIQLIRHGFVPRGEGIKREIPAVQKYLREWRCLELVN